MITAHVVTLPHIVAYAVCYMICVRTLLGDMAYHQASIGKADQPVWDNGESWFVALMFSLIWPVFLTIRASWLANKYLPFCKWPRLLMSQTERTGRHNLQVKEHAKRAQALEMPVS